MFTISRSEHGHGESLNHLGHTLDTLLTDQPYISGWCPSTLDTQVLARLSKPTPDLPNLLRWFNHLQSYSEKGEEKDPKKQGCGSGSGSGRIGFARIRNYHSRSGSDQYEN